MNISSIGLSNGQNFLSKSAAPKYYSKAQFDTVSFSGLHGNNGTKKKNIFSSAFDSISEFFAPKSQRNPFVLYKNPRLDKKYSINKSDYPMDVNSEKFREHHSRLELSHSKYEWDAHFPKNGSHCPWKMHIYADNTTDSQMIADSVGKYLTDNDVDWKMLHYNVDFSILNGCQHGKCFTVYPKSLEEFKKIACDVDYILKTNGLKDSGNNIAGDRQLGDSGRLFYRYEFKSKYCKDSMGRYALDPNFNLDFSKPGQMKYYHDELYQGNFERQYEYNMYGVINGGARYLAPDMTVDDDPFYNFDPSRPANNPEFKKLGKNGYYPYKEDSVLLLPDSAGNDGKMTYLRIDLNDKKFKKAVSNLKPGHYITIGRSESDINLGNEHEYMSRNHLIVANLDGQIFIADNSTNGTLYMR